MATAELDLRGVLAEEENWQKGAMATIRKPMPGESPLSLLVWRFLEEAKCFCLLGAFRRVYCRDPNYSIKLHRLAEAIRNLFPARVQSVVTDNQSQVVIVFNDHPDTTHADVLAVIEESGL